MALKLSGVCTLTEVVGSGKPMIAGDSFLATPEHVTCKIKEGINNGRKKKRVSDIITGINLGQPS